MKQKVRRKKREVGKEEKEDGEAGREWSEIHQELEVLALRDFVPKVPSLKEKIQRHG